MAGGRTLVLVSVELHGSNVHKLDGAAPAVLAPGGWVVAGGGGGVNMRALTAHGAPQPQPPPPTQPPAPLT